eukprot:gene32073-41591_t
MATIAALGTGSPMASLMGNASVDIASKIATADSVILLWMAGGMAHTETFDPKRYTSFEKDGIQFSEGLQSIGSVMDKGTLIRSYVAADLGSWISKQLGPKNPVIPSFIDIGQRFTVGEAEELKAFHTAGFLGNEHGPFFIPDPSQGLDSVRPPVVLTESMEAIFKKNH